MIDDVSYQNNTHNVPEIIDYSELNDYSDVISKAIIGGLQGQLAHVKTLVAMPAYNEAAHIADVIAGAMQFADRVLVVDDGSIDDTVSIAMGLGAIVVRHESNKGYGGALQTIFSTARDLDVEELVILDADGQHDCGDIPRLLDELRRGNDVVIGSRFNGVSGEGVPRYRKVGMKVLDIATMLAGSDLEITDSQSGFRVYGKRAIEVINIDAEGMSAGSEILVQISDHRLKVAEVPIRVRYDLEGTSSENPVAHGFGVLQNLAKLIIVRRPLPLFGIPGFLFAGIGIGALAYYSYNYSHIGEFYN
ncbi:MAG TPA: glycosyltransferase family 2 protein, partial [Methanomassiliicoccaceae archaeon]|nr:glycosyltransferase family 2 protein [Methanomassiliicoccaceae archaeon]